MLSISDSNRVYSNQFSEMGPVDSLDLCYQFYNVSEYPTGTATYIQGTSVSDMWSGWSGSIYANLTVSDGTLISTVKVGQTVSYAMLTSALGTPACVRVRVKTSVAGNISVRGTVGGTPDTLIAIAAAAANVWYIVDGLTSGALTVLYIAQSGLVPGDTLTIDWVYVGNGSYAANSAVDCSGNSNHGTIYGATPTDWTYGKALLFDGINDYAQTTNSIQQTNEMTISLWAKYTSITAEGLLFRFGTISVDGVYVRGTTTSGQLAFVFSRAGASETVLVNNTRSTSYFHLALRFNNETRAYSVFYNGVQISSGSLANIFALANTAITLGRYSAGANMLDGSISQFRLYNRSLSASEVSQLYKLKR